MDQHRPEPFHPDGTVVAEGEEGDEEHPAQHRDEEPARGGLLKGKRKGKSAPRPFSLSSRANDPREEDHIKIKHFFDESTNNENKVQCVPKNF